jgi:hypothetical protein
MNGFQHLISIANNISMHTAQRRNIRHRKYNHIYYRKQAKLKNITNFTPTEFWSMLKFQKFTNTQ